MHSKKQMKEESHLKKQLLYFNIKKNLLENFLFLGETQKVRNQLVAVSHGCYHLTY